MKKLGLILTSLFYFFLFDLTLFRRHRRDAAQSISTELEISDQKEKLKKAKRRYQNKKYKRRKFFAPQRFKYIESKPKDARYTNQKTLRRMYRND